MLSVAGLPAIANFKTGRAPYYLRRTAGTMLDSAETVSKRFGLFGDFQFKVLMDHCGETEYFALDDRQERRHNMFKSVENTIAAGPPKEMQMSSAYVHKVFQVALRRLMPYNFVEDGLDFEFYSSTRKPAGQLVPLQTLVVSLLS